MAVRSVTRGFMDEPTSAIPTPIPPGGSGDSQVGRRRPATSVTDMFSPEVPLSVRPWPEMEAVMELDAGVVNQIDDIPDAGRIAQIDRFSDGSVADLNGPKSNPVIRRCRRYRKDASWR